MTDIDPSAVGYVAVGLIGLIGLIAGFLGLIVTIRNLLKAEDPDKQFVTRAELGKAVRELELRMDSIKNDVTLRMNQINLEIGAKVDKLYEYSSRTNHENANVMQNLLLKVERLTTLREMDARVREKEANGE